MIVSSYPLCVGFRISFLGFPSSSPYIYRFDTAFTRNYRSLAGRERATRVHIGTYIYPRRVAVAVGVGATNSISLGPCWTVRLELYMCIVYKIYIRCVYVCAVFWDENEISRDYIPRRLRLNAARFKHVVVVVCVIVIIIITIVVRREMVCERRETKK